MKKHYREFVLEVVAILATTASLGVVIATIYKEKTNKIRVYELFNCEDEEDEEVLF